MDDDQGTNRQGSWGMNLDPEFRADLDEILTWSDEFTIDREPLSECDLEDLRALMARMSEFRRKWHIDGPNFKLPTR